MEKVAPRLHHHHHHHHHYHHQHQHQHSHQHPHHHQHSHTSHHHHHQLPPASLSAHHHHHNHPAHHHSHSTHSSGHQHHQQHHQTRLHQVPSSSAPSPAPPSSSSSSSRQPARLTAIAVASASAGAATGGTTGGACGLVRAGAVAASLPGISPPFSAPQQQPPPAKTQQPQRPTPQQQQQQQQYQQHQQQPASLTVAATVQLGSQFAQTRRKEKARIAARARRSQEASIIMEMAHELHISQDKLRRIDKATIVKLAIDYIKAFDILCRFCSGCCGPAAAGKQQPAPLALHLGAPRNTMALMSALGAEEDEEEDAEDDGTLNLTTRTAAISTTTTTASSAAAATTRRLKESMQSSIANINISMDMNINATTNRIPCITPATTTTTTTMPASNLAPITQQTTKQRLQKEAEEEERSRPTPRLSTGLIFAPKTDDMDSHFLMINERDGRPAYVLKPDHEILEEDDLTHLAPSAGDSISLEVEPLEGIELDTGLFGLAGSPSASSASTDVIGSLLAADTTCAGCHIGPGD